MSSRVVVGVRRMLRRERTLFLAHAEGVLGGLGGIAEGLRGRVKDALALLGGVVVGAGDGVGGLLAHALLAGCSIVSM